MAGWTGIPLVAGFFAQLFLCFFSEGITILNNFLSLVILTEKDSNSYVFAYDKGPLSRIRTRTFTLPLIDYGALSDDKVIV